MTKSFSAAACSSIGHSSLWPQYSHGRLKFGMEVRCVCVWVCQCVLVSCQSGVRGCLSMRRAYDQKEKVLSDRSYLHNSHIWSLTVWIHECTDACTYLVALVSFKPHTGRQHTLEKIMIHKCFSQQFPALSLVPLHLLCSFFLPLLSVSFCSLWQMFQKEEEQLAAVGLFIHPLISFSSVFPLVSFIAVFLLKWSQIETHIYVPRKCVCGGN